jgi:hypothetical protein
MTTHATLSYQRSAIEIASEYTDPDAHPWPPMVLSEGNSAATECQEKSNSLAEKIEFICD